MKEGSQPVKRVGYTYFYTGFRLVEKLKAQKQAS